MQLPRSSSRLTMQITATEEIEMSPTEFVDALVADLEPVHPAAPWPRVLFMWCFVSWLIVGGVILASGPLREDVVGELLRSPRFGLELALGFAAGITAIWAGLELGVPGGPPVNRLWGPPAFFFAAWALVIAFGFLHPNLSSDMTGRRPHCFVQILLASLPPLVLAIHFLRNRIAFARSAAGLLVGAAAAAIPALWMQIACQTGSAHVLVHHFSPILLVGGVGAGIAHWVLSRA